MMAESAALLVDDVFPRAPVRQCVLSFPFQLRFLFASYPDLMGKVLGIVYRTLATHIIHKAGFGRRHCHPVWCAIPDPGQKGGPPLLAGTDIRTE